MCLSAFFGVWAGLFFFAFFSATCSKAVQRIVKGKRYNDETGTVTPFEFYGGESDERYAKITDSKIES